MKTHFRLSLLFLPLIIVLFILSRLSYLHLPFYWDEAWSYATAVFNMHEKGLAILPGDSNTELTRGHPLLFYFLSALWIKIFGSGLTIVHLFPLIISCILLIVIYFFSADLFCKATAMAAVVLFILQTEFLTQSTMLLPEVMMALWTILSVYNYFRKKWALFAIFSVFLVMTKETGMVLIGTLFIDKVILEHFFNQRNTRPTLQLFRELAIMSIPVIVFSGFMIMQKIRLGWFLFPEHVNMTVINPHEILERICVFSSKLFFQHGRNVLFFGALAAFVYLKIKGLVEKQQARVLFFLVLFILFYIVFSSVNYFTTRYLLSVLPLYIILCTWLIMRLLQRRFYLKIIAVVAFVLMFSYYTFIGNQNESDISLGFKRTVLLHKQAVNFAEEMQWQDKSIQSTFLMLYNLTNPKLGYLNNKTHPFTRVSNQTDNKYDVYLFCSNEMEILHSSIENNSDYYLVKRFENEGAWVDFYMKKEY
jgi:4-amino-4-deoxy-L-arabinose transferase-like glycosyltransferase